MDVAASNIEIFVSVGDGTDESMAKAMEKLTTVATGLALEGLRVTITIHPGDDFEDEDE